jgi:hypothetical protein
MAGIILSHTLGGAEPIVEASALHHGHWWGPWVAVVTISSLIPFEVVALLCHVHLRPAADPRRQRGGGGLPGPTGAAAPRSVGREACAP